MAEPKQELLDKMPGAAGEDPRMEILKEGGALIRLENTTQMQIAVQRPRDEAKILSDSLKELELYPSMAEEVLYSKPVGKEEGTNQQKYVTGLSIRTAESLANRWTNSAYGCDVIAEDADSVTLAAVFMDYENNTRHVMQKKVSKSYKAKGGAIVRYPPDRFNDVVLPANQSKLLREVILRSLPAGLKSEYEDKARTILGAGDKTNRSNKMLRAFLRLGIAKSQLEELAGKKVADFTNDDISEYIGIHNALRDGETTMGQLIAEKTGAEKLGDRMNKNGQQPQGAPAQPSTPAAAPTPAGLTGMRLALYEKVAEMAAGDMLEMGKILTNLSGGKIKGKEDLIAAADDVVSAAIDKMGGKK